MITAPKHHHGLGLLHALARFVLKQQCDTVIASVADEELRLRKVRCFDQSHTAVKWQCQDWSVPPRTVPLARTRTRGLAYIRGGLGVHREAVVSSVLVH